MNHPAAQSPPAALPHRVSELWPPCATDTSRYGCEVRRWAASGAMDLTGPAGGPPDISPAPAFAQLGDALHLLARTTAALGRAVTLAPGPVLTARAVDHGFRRAGTRSAGGSTRLLRTADGWCALTLSRVDDIAAVPAIIGAHRADDHWKALAQCAVQVTAAEFADRAQLLGVPAAALPPDGATADPCAPPWQLSRLAAPTSRRELTGRLVVDLSSMWAGPLCAHILGRAGARVITVESPHRPDGARADRHFFGTLHAGHEFRAIDFRTDSGRTELATLLAAADIVIEASRPRALAQLGLGPDRRGLRPGQIWVGLTGYGRSEPMRVAFGDDAAVAGGLVGTGHGMPVFCADAIGDPLSGIAAALAVCAAVRAGGGVLADVSMRAVTAAFAAAPPRCPGPHRVFTHHGRWQVRCAHTATTQAVLSPRSAQARAASGFPGGVAC
ncbi:hypothetical protein J2W56_000213 [Nocardia kruczakiae]|uniref:CoA transferase family III n=1 Tax=Nocardia kruczakiae TaxID=261477 RepID=A0ABU1X7J3_9NOCA|nr:CoA transferase [Nocardia kruczakiae]MDR7166495.1 hypothetical protein [Nocardia kruczakiae]